MPQRWGVVSVQVCEAAGVQQRYCCCGYFQGKVGVYICLYFIFLLLFLRLYNRSGLLGYVIYFANVGWRCSNTSLMTITAAKGVKCLNR